MALQNTSSSVPLPPDNVPGRLHYGAANYLGQDLIRLCSYREQVSYAIRSNPKTVLIIGKGDGIAGDLLQRSGIDVTTLDIQADLKPDIVGSVDAIPLPSKSYDVVLCCQVLEHLPFERFGSAINELSRVSRHRLVLSFPDVRRFMSVRIHLARFRLNWQLSLRRIPVPRIPRERFDVHGHYWEIGFRGSAFRDVCQAIENAGCQIIETHRVDDLPWHTFIYAAPHAEPYSLKERT